MIHHRNDKQIPESILISLYSHAVPKEDLISSMDNLFTFDENANIFVENQKSQSILNEFPSSNEFDKFNSEVSENSELSQKNTLNDLSKFLYYFNLNSCRIFKYDIFKQQFNLVIQLKDNVGMQLCLASFTQSLPAMAYFLLNSNITNQDRYSKSYAQHGINCIRNYDISSTFVPDFTVPPLLSIPISEEIPRTPTSVATSTTKLYVGGQNSIQIIPLYRYEENKPLKIPIPINNEQYSLTYIKSIESISNVSDNGQEFLLFSTISTSPLFINPLDGEHCPIRVVYRSIFSSKSYPFAYPIISDGQYLYSIEFGSSAKLKIFIFTKKEIFFIRSVSFQKGKNPLKNPFKDLLPIKQRDTASIATNGLFISFLFEIPESDFTLCRIFLVRSGIHVRDEIIQSPTKIRSWTFDLKRPSHCLIIETMMLLIDSQFTLPTWFIGFEDQFLESQEMKNQTNSIIDCYSYELSIYASHFIGSKSWPSLNFNNIPDIEPLENLMLQFIDIKNKMAAQAFLLLLPFKILNGDSDQKILLKILDKLLSCFGDKKYESLHKLIVYVFLVSFDSFAQTNLEKTALFLSEIIFSEQYSILLFKYLPNSSNLTNSLTPISLKVICEMALDSSFIFASDAIAVLRQIQSDLIVHENHMLIVYIKSILEHFIKDLKLLMDNKWSEQRFLSCTSFNIFKELILVVENVRYDYDFSIYLIIEFFSVGSFYRKGCSSLIFKVIERSIHFAFEMFLHKIEEDKSFYNIENNKIFDEFLGKKRELKFDEFGLNEKIITEFKKVVDNSYVANLDDDFIINEINTILNKVRTGKVTEEKFLEKCKNVFSIQPQLFANVSYYFKNDIEFTVLNSGESVCNKFITLFSSSIYQDSSSFRSVFLYFVPQIYHIRQYFLMVPTEIMKNFISHFKLWYFLMPEILLRSEITHEMLDKLPTKSLLYSGQTLFSISQNIQKVESSFDENRMLRSLILYNINNHNNNNNNRNEIELNEIVLKCLTTGNYEIIRQTMILILLLIDENNLSIIDKCLEFIGTYLNEEKIMFYYQIDRLTCFQNCFLIADYLREIFKKISIDLYFERIKSKGGFKYSEKLGLFLVMNNSIDTLRMNCHVSAISNTGQKFSGIVIFFDDKNIAIETEDHSIQYMNDYNSYDCTFSGYYSFDPKQFKYKDFEFIKSLIIEFDPKLSFHNIFKYATLKEFMKIDQFCLLFNEEEIITSIASKIDRSLTSVNQSINDFSQLMIFHMTPLPVFAFNHSQNEFLVKPHSATVETMRNSFFNRTQQKDLKDVEISDTLISFDESSFYVSTPLHPTVNTKMTFKIHSSVTMDPQLTLTICMLGKSSNAFFKSQPLICDSSSETLIEIRPLIHSIHIHNHSINDVNIFLQPSCEFIFITAKLAASTVVDYTFHYGYEDSSKSNFAEIVIPRIFDCQTDDDSEFVLPFQTSSIFVDAQMKEDTNSIVSHFALEIILNFPHFDCTHKYVPFALLNADQVLYDTNVDIKNLKSCQFTEFAEKVLNIIKESDEKVHSFVDFLMTEIQSKWKRYKKSAFGPYNMTASIFTTSSNNQMMKQKNIYVVTNKKIFYNPSESQLNEFDGMTYIIRSDDITDSVVEFFVRVRHLAAILLFISNSNIFLVENITKLIKIFQKENKPFIVSLDPIIEVLNRLIPKHRIILTSKDDQNALNSNGYDHIKISRKARGLCYIGVTNVDVESKGFLNFSVHPIESSKLGVSRFSIDDSNFNENEELFDSNPAIINPSVSESDIVLEKKIMKIKDWTVSCFPFYFENNVDNLDAQIEMFFSMNNSLKCFPLTNFLDQLFYCNSCEYKIDKTMNYKDQKNIIFFESGPSLNDEFIYLNIYLKNKRSSVELSLDESFGDVENIVNIEGGSSFILPPVTFFIKFNSDEFDYSDIELRWKKFVFREESFYMQIQNEVFKWKPCFSHQILLSFPDDEIMTYDQYNLLPISTLISYEIASFFLHILRKKPKYIENHTFDYEIERKEIENEKKIILQFLPELNYTSVIDYKPKNSEEAAFVVSLLFLSPKELNYTIPFQFWKEICSLNSPSNLIFNRLTKVYKKIEPTYLRMTCTKNNFSDAETVLNLIDWTKIDENDQRRKWIIDYLGHLKPFVLNLFVECVTGHWGTKSLIESENPFILIEKVDEIEKLKFHQSIHVIAIGKYNQKNKLIDDLKLRMHQSITSVYL